MSDEGKQEEIQDPIEIDEVVEQEAETEDFSVEGLSDYEISMAKELNLVKDKAEPEAEEDSKEDIEEVEDVEDNINTDPDNFEDMDEVINKDEKKFHEKYSPNQKALYFKHKASKKRAQELRAEADELRKSIDELRASSQSNKKIDKLKEVLKRGDATYEEFDSILNEKEEEVKKEEKQPVVSQEKINSKLSYVDKIGKAKYDDFEELSKLAEELALKDDVYKKIIVDGVLNDEVDEAEVVEQIVKIAKFHPKYGETAKKEVKLDPKMEKIKNNIQKKPSSASVGGSGKRIISERELTVAQAEAMTPAQFAKLKPETQQRLLLEASKAGFSS